MTIATKRVLIGVIIAVPCVAIVGLVARKEFAGPGTLVREDREVGSLRAVSMAGEEIEIGSMVLPELLTSPWASEARTLPLCVWGPKGTRSMMKDFQQALAFDIRVRRDVDELG